MSSTSLVGRRIAEHLIRSGKSPEQFAEEVGLCNMTIRRLLDAAEDPKVGARMRPHLDTRRKIATWANVETIMLWGDLPAVTKRPRKKAGK